MKKKSILRKKFTFKNLLRCLVAIIGLVFLTWLNSKVMLIHFDTTLQKFVATHPGLYIWLGITNIVVCLFTSNLLGTIFSTSRCTWPLVLVFYFLLMCIFVPSMLSQNSAIYLSLNITRTTKFFSAIMGIKNIFRYLSGILLACGVYFRYKNRHSNTTLILLSLSAILSFIIYELTTFVDARYFYSGLLGLIPILWLAMLQNKAKITD